MKKIVMTALLAAASVSAPFTHAIDADLVSGIETAMHGDHRSDNVEFLWFRA